MQQMAREITEMPPVQSPAPGHPFASIIIPAYNEGAGLAHNLDTLLRYLAAENGAYDYEVVVVDDGSSDETYEIALECAKTNDALRVVRHSTNSGLGAAIRTGFAHARGSIVIPYDSDMSYGIDIVPRMLAEMQATNADLVLASPYMRGGSVANVPFLRRILSREANRFLSFATNGRYATATCMVRAYKKEFFRKIPITEDRMEVNPELFFKAIKAGAAISEIPARLEWDTERARARRGINVARTFKQIGRTFRYGVGHRPAVLLALPGILPGVLPLIITTMVLMHASARVIAIVTLATMIVQNASLALFAGQLTVFGRNVLQRPQRKGPIL
jgi:glycosyltransferase involved in cell wall biosynthesis